MINRYLFVFLLALVPGVASAHDKPTEAKTCSRGAKKGSKGKKLSQRRCRRTASGVKRHRFAHKQPMSIVIQDPKTQEKLVFRFKGPADVTHYPAKKK